ncbi:HmuY family protein [Chitinophaga horti]|uniref:HmuY family protein n=1 Tax=Chitinophaga horti TaxID=2920382 RepID=A0ABY6J951_9BACT|nr:HmuY family protein [Chitinophaga horti]UYQ95107.1 HmuY family protein [Chitinophaga horti]
MTMRITSLMCLSVALFFTACTKERTGPELQDGTSVVIKDLPGDTLANMAGGSSFKNLYFSFTANDKIEVSTTEKPTLKWDLAFTGPYNSEVFVNDGSYEYNPGYGGPGKGAVVIIDKPYDQVHEVPTEAQFEASDFKKIGWDAGNGRGWFFYSLDNHICVPIKNRTFAIRTATGKYAKLELINIYKGNPPVVTDLFWPAPYVTFRYFVQEDGSRNVRTK